MAKRDATPVEPIPPRTRARYATSRPAQDHTRVLVVDDHPLLRRGVIAVLKETTDIEVVAEAGSGKEAIKLCEEKHPDVVLMDLMLPDMSGLDAIQALHAKHPDIRQVVLTNYGAGDMVQQSLQAGAISFLLKDKPPENLIRCIRLARVGKSMVDEEVIGPLVREVASQRLGQNLTPREREVLTWLVRGYSNLQIADQLVIAPSTVKFHLSSISSKLHTTSRSETIVMALRNHIVSQGEV